MTKKDEKDSDRPHYYSQFWLDVAAGRRVIGTPKPEEGADDAEADLPEPTPLARRGGHAVSTPPVDGYRETRATAVTEPDYADGDFNEPEEEEEDAIDLAGDLDDEDIPNIVVDDTLDQEADDLELPSVESEDEEDLDEEEEFFEEEEEEEEEDEEWPARGRKKAKPGRQAKPPKPPVKKPKRGGRF